jgi:hypothetical protein
MVEARGGIESVGRSNILLARILIWTSMVMGTKPQYPHLVDVGLVERPQLLRQKRSIPLGSSPSKFARLDIDGDTLELLLNIQHISRLITFSIKNVSPIDPRPLQDAISYLLHSILTVPTTATASCCCSRYAGALYILFFANSRFPNPDRMISRLIDDLRVSIERVEFEKRRLSSFAFWLLSVGGVAAAGQPRRSWFVARLMKLAPVLNLGSWDEVRDLLARFLWIEPICSSAYKSLWEEVGYMKEGVQS